MSCQVQVGSCYVWGKGLEIVEKRNNNSGLNVYIKVVKGIKKFNGADTTIELRGGPVEVGIGIPGEIGDEGLWGMSPVKLGLVWSGWWVMFQFLVWIAVGMAAYGYFFD